MWTELKAYLKYRAPLLGYYLLSMLLIPLVPFAAGERTESAGYLMMLLSAALLALLLIDGPAFVRRRRALKSLLDCTAEELRLPEPQSALEADYLALIQKLLAEGRSMASAFENAGREQLHYYTLWVHQIKTPIAAMRLVLQNGDFDESSALRQELFKIEEYADLALRYAKLTEISADLVFAPANVNDAVRASVKKFALPFIAKNLTVSIQPMDLTVVTDIRWLQFIIEQVLSNAVKYTKAGGVTISLDGRTLNIADTGVGVRPEDLPRIFERGYTGFNGRRDTRASGIGLYLAKKAADALDVRLSASSAVNAGTTIHIQLPADARPLE